MARVKKKPGAVCVWRWNGDFWEGDCGIPWMLHNDGTPKENGMNYCPKCGSVLKERAAAMAKGAA